MTRYHLKMRESDFPQEVIAATNLLFEAKPWRLDIGVLDLYQRWADVVTDVYGAGPVGVLKIDAEDVAGFGYEPGVIPNILIGRYSLATLFCAMGLHIHGTMGGLPTESAHIEWGFSLFYVVRPVMFRRRVREGRIMFETARDTFTVDTWNRLERMGLTNGNHLVDPHFDIRTLDAEDDLVSPDEVEEAEEADEDIAPVISLRSGRIEDELEQYLRENDSRSITYLRRASRGVVSGGYNMRKQELLIALFNAGVEL